MKEYVLLLSKILNIFLAIPIMMRNTQEIKYWFEMESNFPMLFSIVKHSVYFYDRKLYILFIMLKEMRILKWKLEKNDFVLHQMWKRVRNHKYSLDEAIWGVTNRKPDVFWKSFYVIRLLLHYKLVT